MHIDQHLCQEKKKRIGFKFISSLPIVRKRAARVVQWCKVEEAFAVTVEVIRG